MGCLALLLAFFAAVCDVDIFSDLVLYVYR